MAKKQNNTVAAPVEDPQVQDLAGTDVTPESELASPEALNALTGAAKQIAGNGIKPNEKETPQWILDDKARVPMGSRTGFQSGPIYQARGDLFIEGFVKVQYTPGETPTISVGVPVEHKGWGQAPTQTVMWTQFHPMNRAQEEAWASLEHSRNSLAFVSALILTESLRPVQKKSNRR